MNKEKFIKLCPLYFLDALEEKELDEFKKALESGDKELLKIYSDFRQTTFHLPLAAEQVEPPLRVKQNIFNAIKAAQQTEKYNAIDKLITLLGLKNPTFAFALSIIMLVGLTVLTFFVIQKDSTINSQQSIIVQLKDKVQKDAELLKILSAKKIDVVIMNGLEVNPAGYGKMVIDPVKKQAILQVSNLPETTSDKDYQLWVIKDNKPISNGVFTISKNKENNFFMITNIAVQDINNIKAFAITLEPKGGVPQPTGKMYLAGNASL